MMVSSRSLPAVCFLAAATSFAVSAVFGLAGCGSSNPPPAAITSTEGDLASPPTTPAGDLSLSNVRLEGEHSIEEKPAVPEKDPVVVVKTNYGEIRVQLEKQKAPVTVENFLDYVQTGFYDQTVFHYVDQGFMIAAGGYTADLKPKESRAQIRNEAQNGLKNVRGTIAMSRVPDYIDSATSHFFINLVDNPSLDHQSLEAPGYGYCVFGKVIAGLEIIDQMAQAPVKDAGAFPKTPVQPIVIESIRRVE